MLFPPPRRNMKVSIALGFIGFTEFISIHILIAHIHLLFSVSGSQAGDHVIAVRQHSSRHQCRCTMNVALLFFFFGPQAGDDVITEGKYVLQHHKSVQVETSASHTYSPCKVFVCSGVMATIFPSYFE